MRTTTSTTLILNLDAGDAWQRLRDALASVGCDEPAAAFVWEEIKSKDLGQLNPATRAKPTRNFFDLERALNAELGPSLLPGEVAVVWQRAGPLAPRNVRIVIHHASV